MVFGILRSVTVARHGGNATRIKVRMYVVWHGYKVGAGVWCDGPNQGQKRTLGMFIPLRSVRTLARWQRYEHSGEEEHGRCGREGCQNYFSSSLPHKTASAPKKTGSRSTQRQETGDYRLGRCSAVRCRLLRELKLCYI